ncbi:Uncharacterised protein [Bordetella pertussis]|nr:Uncharacterised protein [Bordetella pertussis]CFW30467.1 Uncharacterised protein [Bordetella pertussis]
MARSRNARKRSQPHRLTRASASCRLRNSPNCSADAAIGALAATASPAELSKSASANTAPGARPSM